MSEHYNDEGPDMDEEATETAGQLPTYPGILVEDWEGDLQSL